MLRGGSRYPPSSARGGVVDLLPGAGRSPSAGAPSAASPTVAAIMPPEGGAISAASSASTTRPPPGR
eukprot:7814614-Pyramimonas_sp.AAC.1